MSQIIEEKTISQIALVVENIEETVQKYAEIFGMPAPTIREPILGESKITVHGVLAPEVIRKIAIFPFANIQLELIETNQTENVWRDVLDTKGEGFHHINFRTNAEDKTLERFAENNIPVFQEILSPDGNNGCYYMETRDDLKCFVEIVKTLNK